MNDSNRTGPYQPATVDEVATALPPHIGRYRIERILGQGGFGLVYLARDDQLQRPVAVKVPHRRLVSRPEDAEAYLTEARTVANLDHPHIVPVFDVGSTENYPCFIVSKYIDGTDLRAKAQTSPLSVEECAELAATVAEALHHAHKQGLVHRDIKPGNILLDKNGKAFVADFGLALREQDVGKGPRFAGTPAYMSPEQARGEGHRVDGRSDIFSLGVVLYELLTGRRPFHADSREELLEQITSLEVRPPRQWEDTIPKELERICLKALSKRATERYTTAKDMAGDLRHFLAEASAEEKSTVAGREKGEGDAATAMPSPVPTPSDQQAIKIVPKGLRSFDAGDADFFLELLPGPRDREGLPDSIRFWKTRLETTEADSTFAVGLIYGPSGCGKSSLLKAGLLPRLAESVTAVYVEATADDTEARLLKGLRRQIPELPDNRGLIEALGALRQGRFPASGRKVLLVLDQFEQWLHGKRTEENTELVAALRQCDGGRVQCLVLVRDDFWLAVSRFMGDLEVELVQGHNMALVDLFDPRHAKKVLTAFGRAFGALPERADGLTREQEAFLDQSVSGLAQEGKVISVRLALFAEMVKGKPWTPATMKEVGGMEGVGVTFLEETFTASTAPPQHRLHQKATQAVLKALLPDSGTDIKGNMRSRQELLAASGYPAPSRNFEVLLRILDGELRLITPTDPEGIDSESASSPMAKTGEKYYQLTHDYLVPSLRDWLTRKQKETRRGRAELLLAERAGVWSARPENRQLPSLVQLVRLRCLTAPTNWTRPQRQMMRRASWYHGVRGLALAALLVALTVAGWFIRAQVHAGGLVNSLLNADIAQVPDLLRQLQSNRPGTEPLLRAENAKAREGSRAKLYTSLALLPGDPTQVKYLQGRLLRADPTELPVIRDALVDHKDDLEPLLWKLLRDNAADAGQRFRAACALAVYNPTSNQWPAVASFVADQLLAAVQDNPSHYDVLRQSLDRVRQPLLAPLAEVFRSASRSEADRSWATSFLKEFAGDQPVVLAGLLQDADARQFAGLFARVESHKEEVLPFFRATVQTPINKITRERDKERLGKRQANVAAALLRLGQPQLVWPLLKQGPDPRARSYLIHRLSPLGTDPQVIIKRLEDEPDVSIRCALVLALGEFSATQLPASRRGPVIEKLLAVYEKEADPGMHAAAEWLLRTWKQEAWLKQVNEKWAKDQGQRAKRQEGIGKLLAKDKEKAPPQWYVNGQGQTMVVIPGPVEFVMGSPKTEKDHVDNEVQHKRRIGRTFALASKAVTLAQYRRLTKDRYEIGAKWTRHPDLPVVGINWYMAAAYCNLLSKEEGIDEDQWCYEFKGREVKLKEGYLSLTGYRLPTEAEMEYATRAKAETSRYYGETEELLGNYAWYLKNANELIQPVGRKKPNDLGFFDLHGNVFNWCQERYLNYPAPNDDNINEDKEDNLSIDSANIRVLRGGSFVNPASYVRSAYRDGNVPANRDNSFGFRPARTLLLGSFTALPPAPQGGK